MTVGSSRKLKVQMLMGSDDAGDPELGDVPIYRAGFLPFIPAEKLEDWKVLVIKPVSDPARYSAGDSPKFQLAKGSRRALTREGWQDVDEVPETMSQSIIGHEEFVDAALRELEEEASVGRDNIEEPVYDAGNYRFTSASSGKPKGVRMFASAVKDPDRLGDLDPGITVERRWMTLEQFASEGRTDQYAIAKNILEKIQKYQERQRVNSDARIGR